MSYDGVLALPIPLTTGYWTMSADRLRGGFRYLTIVSGADSPVTYNNAPHSGSGSGRIYAVRINK